MPFKHAAESHGAQPSLQLCKYALGDAKPTNRWLKPFAVWVKTYDE